MPAPPIVQGYTGLTQVAQIGLETNQPTPGEPLLMPQTAGAATMSLTTQPNTLSPTTGMHLHFFVQGNTSAGTIGIVGTNASGGAQTSQTYHVAIAPQNNQGYTEFTTTEIWDTVTASSITLSAGLTTAGCIVWVYGSMAAKYLVPVTADAEEKIARHSPTDKRGILWKNFRVTQLTKGVSLDKFDCDLYPDSLWMYYLLIGLAPVVTTVPSSPTVLLASTAIAASMTLTSAPASPGEFLAFTITGNTLAGTIVLGGTDSYGMAYGSTETITFTSAASQTVYSSRRYSVVNNGGANKFATTGGTGASIAVGGVFGWTYTWTFDGINNLATVSAALSIFDGVMGKILPGTILTDGTWDWQKEKNVAFTGKGEAQDYCIVGDPNPTTYPSGTNPFATLAQPTSMPMVSWPGTFTIDPGSGTPLSTQDGSFLTFKLGLLTGLKWMFAGSGMQRADYVTRDSEPDFSIDATGIFQNYANYVGYFKQNLPIILGAKFQGNLLGSIGGTPYFEAVQWTLPCRLDTTKVDPSKNAVEVAFKTLSEYSFTTLGAAFKCAVTCQQPPVYLS